jgi:hypothetical protein
MPLGRLSKDLDCFLCPGAKVVSDFWTLLRYLVEPVVEKLAVVPEEDDVVLNRGRAGLACVALGGLLGFADLEELGYEAFGRRDVLSEVNSLMDGPNHRLKA